VGSLSLVVFEGLYLLFPPLLLTLFTLPPFFHLCMFRLIITKLLNVELHVLFTFTMSSVLTQPILLYPTGTLYHFADPILLFHVHTYLDALR